MTADYYNLLGLPFDAAPEEIRSAYFEVARRLHPDANPDPLAREQFLRVQEAYDFLSNPTKRKNYDLTLPDMAKIPLAVGTSIRISRSVIPAMNEPQLIYALIDLICTGEPDLAKLPPSSICLVLDRSTSMRGERIEMVKANVAQLVRHLRPYDLISIVAFSDRAEVVIPPTRVNELTKLEGKISLLGTSGSTELYQGLEAGVDLLRRTPENFLVRHLVLLTDGHTYGDEENCLLLARTAQEENISMSALGFGSEWNDSFLDQLVSISGGTTIFVTSPKDLTNYLAQKMESIGVAYASAVNLEIENDPSLEIRYAFRLRPDLGPVEIGNPIPLGGLNYGKGISLLLEIFVDAIPPHTREIDLGKGRIVFKLPSQLITTGRLNFDIRRPVAPEVEREIPPAAIVEALSKLTLYRLQDRARSEVENGDIADATKHLHHLATHLLARGDRELAHTVLVEAEHIQQSRRFSKDGDKRIKYGTRALLLLPGPGVE
ncbi:DnaJ-class molecular chaperone with C-terminal Zn finger domain [Longilinea arvoryzae]|uniref:DnaJ-class molecular chaperone with C-terminal Zn finger domain n=1 Tax=Longilinea arvoryzae TaxID=360412 RepID=A0A0S7BL53_9CHLR|nr:DnaJ domain-containing protein [Longilinea arvoryzae]GAP14609.1 DnaJ-class molecular chaperone with C-terminal Zn finger domain [Longilinea arvoryzae]